MILVPFFSGGNGDTELGKSRTGSQVRPWFQHLCSSPRAPLPLRCVFAMCVICQTMAREEGNEGGALTLRYPTARDAVPGELRALACLSLLPASLHTPRRGCRQSPLQPARAQPLPTAYLISIPSYVSIPKSPVGPKRNSLGWWNFFPPPRLSSQSWF